VVKVASADNERQWVDVARSSSRRDLAQKVVFAKRRTASRRHVDPAQIELTTVTDRSTATRIATGGVAPEQQTAVAPAPAETLPGADAPVAVTFRLTPLQLARFESLLEKIHKTGRVPRGASREDILLAALDELVTDESETGDTMNAVDKDSQDEQLLPRRNSASNYRVIIQKCETCQRANVQTKQGEKHISAAELATVECDAVIQCEGKRNTSVIPPSVRQAVLARDRYRCQSTGCGNTRFLEIHHIMPRARGGSNRKENLTTLCSRCHAYRHREATNRGNVNSTA